MRSFHTTIAAAPAILFMASSALAYDINDKFSVSGVVAAAGQCQDTSGDPAADDTCRGGMPIQPEIDFHPTDTDQFHLKFGFAVDNDLNPVSPFALAPWAADLEDDVKNINGRDRDYLLTAWYKHTFIFSKTASLGATFGIIDSTDYIDDNAFANDEYNQFMNEVFVNSPVENLVSYDSGVVLELGSGPWQVTALGMNVGDTGEDPNKETNYNFWGAQVGYSVKSGLGEGNYRVVVTGTSSAFENAENSSKKDSLFSYGLSFDQEFGKTVGGFLRFSGQQADADAATYESLFSGGLNFAGQAWGREDDNIGIGYAYLSGGSGDIDNTNAMEAYYRASINDYLALTADVQYMDDSKESSSDSVNGWIYGLRITAEF